MFDLQVDLQSPLLHSESSCQLVLTALLYVDASGGDGWYLLDRGDGWYFIDRAMS